MHKIIAVCNQKGGVGKSTTVNSMGAYLFHHGYKVLYIDMDAQGNLSYSLPHENGPVSTMDILTGTATVKEAIKKTPQGDIIPSSPSLAGADAILTAVGKEYRLKESLAPILEEYDFIIIDTPPAIGTLTINALTACHEVIVPAQANIYSLQGIGQLSQCVDTVKKYCNKDLFIRGILVTRGNPRAIVTKDMLELLQETAEQLGTILFDTRIRECIALQEAETIRKDIFEYAPKSNAAIDYKAFCDEYLN